jgi:hypothetical protein
MAYLAALHFENGTWDVFVTEGLIRGVLNRLPIEQDVLGRRLPTYKTIEGLPLVKPSEATRLANELKGLSREKRRDVFRQWSSGAARTMIEQ